MARYDYFCEASQRTIELVHPISEVVSNWVSCSGRPESISVQRHLLSRYERYLIPRQWRIHLLEIVNLRIVVGPSWLSAAMVPMNT